ncbi:MAG: hypothetical protein RJB13_589 [Pseudomonadota bacterium]
MGLALQGCVVKLTTLIAILAASGTASGVERAQRRLNVRHFILPGVHLSAKSNTPPSKVKQEKNTNQSRPSIPAPVQGVTRMSGAQTGQALWSTSCPTPVKVGFFGDFWVAPRSPAVDQKSALLNELRPILSWADFNVVNFEGSITDIKEKAFPKFPFALKQEPSSLGWLSGANIRHLTRANNHAMDFGWEGALETSRAIEKAGMYHTGVGSNLSDALRPMWLEKQGTKIAVFAVTTTYPLEAWAKSKQAGVAHPHRPALRRAIKAAKASADFVVVVFHWGEELVATLRDHQKALAEQTLTDGADVILGHHAHVAQVVDIERPNGIVAYGLGNFIFTSLSRSAKFGLGAHFEFCKSDKRYADGTTHFYRMVLTPLYTYNRETDYRTRFMNLSEFLPTAADYVKKGYFSPELEFYVPEENRVKTLSEWLQLRQQASKEEQAVR